MPNICTAPVIRNSPRTGPSRRTVTRRAILRVSAAGVVSSLAGCQGGTQAPTLDHDAAADLDTQPRLGPPIDDTTATIIVFEDPSCPTCQIFEERTFPKLKSELIEPGKVSFFAREYPIVAPWGEIGSRLLEAVNARSEQAFWKLRAFYYRQQGHIASDDLYDRTRTFLSKETSVDSKQVLTEVQQGGWQDAVGLDIEAAKGAGVRGTPTFFLFKENEYLSKIAGAPSYSMLKNSLGF